MKTKEEILTEHLGGEEIGGNNANNVLLAMEEYAQQQSNSLPNEPNIPDNKHQIPLPTMESLNEWYREAQDEIASARKKQIK